MSDDVVIRLKLEGAEEFASSGSKAAQTLDNFGNAQNRASISSAQMQAALRGVPAQFTDIAVSLASGQKPLTVLLQQGGQLKDMFGGVGNAAKALGGYVVGLVNPFNVAAAAVAGLAIAYQQGDAEARNLGKSLILTGNVAGTSVNQLMQVSLAVSTATGATRGAVVDALQQIISTGKVSGDMLGTVADAAVRMERATGKAVSDSVKEFAELGKAPVEASRKLDDQYNYLTLDIYKQIKALDEQGKTTEAAKVAQEAYAASLKERASSIKENLGDLETAWKAIADAAKTAWDKMLGAGRQQTLEEEIASIKEQLRTGRLDFAQDEGQLREYLARLEARAAAEKQQTAETAKQNDLQQAQKKWLDESDKYLTAEQVKRKEINRVTEQYLKISKEINDPAEQARLAAEYKQRIDAINRQDYLQGLDARVASVKQALSTQVSLTQDAVKLQTKSELAGIEEIKAAKIRASEEEIAVLNKKLGSAQSDGERSAIRVQIQQAKAEAQKATAEADVQLKQLEEKHQAALGKFAAMDVEALTPLQQSWLKFWNENSKTIMEAQANGWSDVIGKMNAAWASVADQTNFTSAKQQYDAMFAEMQEKIESIRQTAEANGGFLAGVAGEQQIAAIKEQYLPALNELIAKMKEAQGVNPVNEKTVTDATRSIHKVSSEIPAIWKSIDQTAHDTFVSIANGGKNVAQRLRDTFKNIFFDWLYQMSLRPIIMQVGAAFTGAGVAGSALAANGATQSAGGIGGLFSLGSGLKSTYDILSKGGIAGTGGLYGSFASSSIGQSLGLSSSSAFVGPPVEAAMLPTTAGGELGLTSLGQSVGVGLGYLGGIGAGFGIGSMISGGKGILGNGPNAAVGVGTAIGAMVGGPLGAVVGGAIGGLVNAAFGSGKKRITGTGITGTFTASGFSGSNYADWKKKGGWFGGGGSGTDYSALSADQRDSYNLAATGMASPYLALQALGGGDSLGDKLNSFSYKVRHSVSSEDEVKAMLQDVSDSMGKLLLPELEDFQKRGEALADTAVRLGQTFLATNVLADVLGKDMKAAFGSLGMSSASVRQSLVEAAGGIDTFKNQVQGYYQAFFTQQEQLERTRKNATDHLAAVGLTMPGTRQQFRSLVEAQDLTTVSGQKTFTALMSVSAAFAELTAKAQEAAQSTERFATRADYIYAQKTGQMPANDSSFSKEIAALRTDLRIAYAELVRANKKVARVVDAWDSDGMPAVRTV